MIRFALRMLRINMKREEARRLLDRIAVLRHGCDLDLLIFFTRHPRSLLASESLAGFLGYNLKEIADSLDLLLGAGLLTRTQTPAHAARLYVLAIPGTSGGTTGEWLPSLAALAATRAGRLALREALTDRRREGTGTVASRECRERSTSDPRRIVATPGRRSATG